MIVQRDAVGDGEVGVAPGLLDEADQVARPALLLQLGRHVDVEHDHAGAAAERRARPFAVGDHRQRELAGLEPVAAGDDAVALQPSSPRP